MKGFRVVPGVPLFIKGEGIQSAGSLFIKGEGIQSGSRSAVIYQG